MILRVKCSPDIRTVSTTICKIVFWRKKLIAENEGLYEIFVNYCNLMFYTR